MSAMDVTVRVNGEERTEAVEPRLLLVHFLRDVLGLTGTHIGCDTTSCGACTVLVDGEPIKSCTMFAVQAHDRDLRTIEGVAAGEELHPLQRGFIEQHGLQCGFCTPGMIMAALPLVESAADPTDTEIRRAISGNICRCTGYANIVAAIRWALDATAAERAEPPPEHGSASTDSAEAAR